jgi:hypothetical protein
MAAKVTIRVRFWLTSAVADAERVSPYGAPFGAATPFPARLTSLAPFSSNAFVPATVRVALRITLALLSLYKVPLMNRSLRRRLLLIGLAGGLVALAFGLGYRLPGADRHPDWKWFPYLTNPHLVVEYIPNFDSIYGRRFPFTREGVKDMFYDDCYRTNLHQIHSLGNQITHNRFRSGISMPRISWTGVAEQNHSNTWPQERGFIPGGYQYLSIQLGSEVGYFKEPFVGANDERSLFYQYNQPHTRRDTLYLRHWARSFRIFYR